MYVELLATGGYRSPLPRISLQVSSFTLPYLRATRCTFKHSPPPGCSRGAFRRSSGSHVGGLHRCLHRTSKGNKVRSYHITASYQAHYAEVTAKRSSKENKSYLDRLSSVPGCRQQMCSPKSSPMLAVWLPFSMN